MKQLLLITLILITGASLFFAFNSCTNKTVVDAIKVTVLEPKKAVSDPKNISPQTIFQNRCKPCHGTHAQGHALSKSDAINTWSSAKIEKALQKYKEGTRNAKGMGSMMHGQASVLNDDEIKALAEYISTLSH